MYIQVPTAPTSTRFAETFESALGQTTTGTSCVVSRETVCRLLSICNVTYDPVLNPRSPYYQRAGFDDPPAVLERAAPTNLVGGRRKIDSCLIGTMQETARDPKSGGVVLAFRGTLATASSASDFLDVVSDWLNDFEAPLVPFKGPFAALTPGIVVHKGFADSIQNLFDPAPNPRTGRTVVDEIKTRLAAPTSNGRLYITGHSKGAALTYLAAFLLHRMGVRPQCTSVISFEAPRCSDQNFATQFDSMGIYSERYEFLNDIVPHVPPAKVFGQMLTTALSFDPRAQMLLSLFYPRAIQSFSYVPVGKLHYVDGNKVIIGDSTLLDGKRLARLVAMVAGAAKDGLVAAAKAPISPGTQPLVALSVYFAKLLMTLKDMHAIDCKSGLMKALCSPIVSPCP